MTETHAYGYSFDSIKQEPSNEYQYDFVKMILLDFCILVHWTKVASASEGLTTSVAGVGPYKKCPPF